MGLVGLLLGDWMDRLGFVFFLLDKGSIVGLQVDFSFPCPALSRRGL